VIIPAPCGQVKADLGLLNRARAGQARGTPVPVPRRGRAGL